MLTKLCAQCNFEFIKKTNESVKSWNTRRKFCSKRCEIISRVGKPIISFTPQNRVRGDRVNTWKGGPILKNCIICNEKFNLRDYAIKNRDTIKCCSRLCSIKYRNTDIFRIKLSEIQRSLPNYVPSFDRKLMRNLRKNYIYNKWRTEILLRDNYTCKLCNIRGGKICVDHIKPFVHILRENNIDSYEKAVVCDELWDSNNARTLCYECHKKTDTFGSKAIKIIYNSNIAL